MKKQYLLLITILLICSLTACNKLKVRLDKGTQLDQEETITSYHITKETYPRVDGSTATIPLSLAVYQLATGATLEEAEATTTHTKTSNSYYSLMDNKADLLIVYEPSEEIYKELESRTMALNIKPIGKDALVFLTNVNNPIQSLTSEEIVSIYSGQITNWREVGGMDKEIIPFQRPDNSGSQTLMNKLVMNKVPIMDAPVTLKPYSMGDILASIAEYSSENNAIGYSVFYYTQNMNQDPLLRYMSVNDIAPSKSTIKDNSYPYINEFYAVIRTDEPKDSNASKIFQWLTSSEGQLLIDELGYVPVQ